LKGILASYYYWFRSLPVIFINLLLQSLSVLVKTILEYNTVIYLILNQDKECGQKRLANNLNVIEICLFLICVLSIHELANW